MASQLIVNTNSVYIELIIKATLLAETCLKLQYKGATFHWTGRDLNSHCISRALALMLYLDYASMHSLKDDVCIGHHIIYHAWGEPLLACSACMRM